MRMMWFAYNIYIIMSSVLKCTTHETAVCFVPADNICFLRPWPQLLLVVSTMFPLLIGLCSTVLSFFLFCYFYFGRLTNQCFNLLLGARSCGLSKKKRGILFIMSEDCFPIYNRNGDTCKCWLQCLLQSNDGIYTRTFNHLCSLVISSICLLDLQLTSNQDRRKCIILV